MQHTTWMMFGLMAIIGSQGAWCDLHYLANAVHPDYPGQCYYEVLNQPIPKNQLYKPINHDGHCEAIYCHPDYVLDIQSCGRHNLMPNGTCSIWSDMRRAFPECCPQLVCRSDNNII